MKFAAPFKRSNEPSFHGRIDEFNITYHSGKRDKLESFLELYPVHRVNIWCPEDINISELSKVNRLYPERIWLRLYYKDLYLIKQLQEEGLSFFLDSTIPISSYVGLTWALSIKPTDIYIYDDLFYNLEEVKNMCDEAGIRIRMILNRTPVTNVYWESNPRAPLYRPQDFVLLDQYIDTAEFDCFSKPVIDNYNDYDWVKNNIQYRIWFIDHKWDDEPFYINPATGYKIPIKYIPEEYNKRKINCQHRCTMRQGHWCKECDRLLALGYINWKATEGDKND